MEHKPHHNYRDVYTVLLRSADGTGANPSKTFYVNWKSVLPQHVKTFKVRAVFNAVESADNTEQFVFISVSSLSLRMYDSIRQGKTNYVAISEAIPGSANNQYNPPRHILEWMTTDYPSNLECVVQVRKLDGDLMTDTGAWFLWLQFVETE